jgi:hypothetical protein
LAATGRHGEPVACLSLGGLLGTMPLTLQLIMAWWLIVTLTACSAYDLWSLFFAADNSTISYQLYYWGSTYPTFYLFLGIIIGHLVFPLNIKK